MTTEQEKEIQARLEFKMNELLTGVKNRVALKYAQAFDMTRKSQYMWQAFEELEEMVKKEINMAPPYDEMAKRKMGEAKNRAVEKIANSLNLIGSRAYEGKIRVIVSAIEEAQNY